MMLVEESWRTVSICQREFRPDSGAVVSTVIVTMRVRLYSASTGCGPPGPIADHGRRCVQN